VSTSVGLVGGLGPESTVDYYRRIIEIWRADEPRSAPAILIDSLDVDRAIELVRTDRPGLIDYLASSVERLARAGCGFAAFAANTPHIVFDDVVARSPIPLLSIVQACADEARVRGYRRVGVLGTGFTMEGSFYPDTFQRSGIAVVVPDRSERAWLHERYLGELLRGIFDDACRRGVVAMADRMRVDDHIDALVLAGTELPMLLKDRRVAGLPVLDTTEIHVRAIVRRLGESGP